MLAGKKRSKQRTSNYVISCDKADLNRKGENFVGKLRSNFVGTAFTVFDDGEAPKDFAKQKKKKGSGQLRKEIVACTYVSTALRPCSGQMLTFPRLHPSSLVSQAKNVMGSKGPRKMRVSIPRLDEKGQPLVFAPTVKDETCSLMRVFKDGDTADLVCMINKPPKWNDRE
ncbi:TUB [Symbiodinium sp. KB8]|nr:TUB [Symbiodinium sp. KB8]